MGVLPYNVVDGMSVQCAGPITFAAPKCTFDVTAPAQQASHPRPEGCSGGKWQYDHSYFAALTFDKKDVRLQCERELKAMLIRLRQGYIAAAANKKLVRDILISTARGLAPLLRAMLWLKDRDRPPGSKATFAKAAEEFSIKTDSLATPGKWRRDKTRLNETQMQSAFESIYATVEQLAGIVDELEV